MRVLATGAQGQVAQSLARVLGQRAGIELVCLGRNQLDLLDIEQIGRIVDACDPDVIINTAAYTDVDGAEDDEIGAMRLNATAAGWLAQAANARGTPIIHISTDYVFSGSKSGAYTEGDATGPINVYGASKQLGEVKVRERAPAHLILRTAWIYGPYGRNFAKTMLGLARDRSTLRVVGDQRGNPTSSLDLAEGIAAVLATWRLDPTVGLGQTFHFAGTGTTSWYGLAQCIFEQSARRGQPRINLLPITSAEWPTRARRPVNSQLDSSRFEATFGHAAPHWETAARRDVDEILAQ